MKNILICLKLDYKLILRHHIATVAFAAALLYYFIFQFMPETIHYQAIVMLIFSDPVMLGFLFIGALLLFEKNARTYQAIAVCPIKPWAYLWSKAISLSILALICSVGLALGTAGWRIHWPVFILAVSYASIVFIFLGFAGAARVKNFNQYILIIPLFLLPACLPFLNFLQITNTLWFYILPTQPALLLFQKAFDPLITLQKGEIIYLLTSMSVWTFLSFTLAKLQYQKFLNS